MRYVKLFAGIACLFFLPVRGHCQDMELADSLNRRGMDFYKTGSYRQAEFYLREAFKLYKKKTRPASWLRPGIDYGEILVDRSKYGQARFLFKQLKKVAVSADNIKARARIENDFGWLYNKMGNDETALVHLRKALPLAKQAQDSLHLGYINDNIGAIYRNRGEYSTSLKYHKKALIFYQKLKNKQSIAIALNNIGFVYKKLSLNDKALEFYEQSLAIKQELGNVGLLATAYTNIALVYYQQGNLDNAIVYYEKSLKYCKEAGNPIKTAQALNNIGTLYNELAQPGRALAYYRESLKLKEQFASPSSLAISYKNIGARLWDSGQKNDAIKYYKKALSLKKKSGDSRAIATSLLDLVKIKKAQGHISEAYSYLNKSRVIADSTQDYSLLKEEAQWRGILDVSQGHFAEALGQYKNALNYGRSLPKDEKISPLIHLATTYDRLNADSTIFYGQQAIGMIEKERSQVGPLSNIKAGYFSQYSNFYIDMAFWALKYRDDVSQAYKLAESAKARSLTDELAKAAHHIDESLPEEARLQRAQKISDISALYSRLKNTTDHKEKVALKSKIRDKELTYTAFENRLRTKYQQYKKIKTPDPVSLQQIQKMCGSETAILEYAVTAHRLIAFFITRDDVRTKRFLLHLPKKEGSSSQLSSQVLGFRKAILSQAPEDSLHVLSAPIYKQLVAPFQRALAPYKNIIVVPSSFLAYLPFEALSHNNNYLVSQFNIKYAPSMTSFSLINPPRDKVSRKLLAIANSSAHTGEANTPVLPTTDIEINSIAKLFSDKTVLRDQQANERKVKKLMQENFSTIHIAAHSVINEKNSSLSGIILNQTDGKKSIDNDGYLRSDEIYRLNVHSNIVVLSACKSGVGRMISGEGMLGLERAFFYAGTSSVVVSLWDVYDRSTTHFMQQFYKNLLDEPQTSWSDSWDSFLRWVGWDDSVPFGHAASAMRAAKLQMLHSPRYHHPIYWAPFIVAGR